MRISVCVHECSVGVPRKNYLFYAFNVSLNKEKTQNNIQYDLSLATATTRRLLAVYMSDM